MSKSRPNIEKGEQALRILFHASNVPEVRNSLPHLRKYVQDNRNELGCCPFCSSPIQDVITNYNDTTAVYALYRLVQWCEKNDRHEFQIKDVKHFLDHTQYANLNHLDRFAGIVYRPIDPATGDPYRGKYYGINIGRAWEFFRNERRAPVTIVSHRMTGERLFVDERLVKDFPSIGEFLDSEGNYSPKV